MSLKKDKILGGACFMRVLMSTSVSSRLADGFCPGQCQHTPAARLAETALSCPAPAKVWRSFCKVLVKQSVGAILELLTSTSLSRFAFTVTLIHCSSWRAEILYISVIYDKFMKGNGIARQRIEEFWGIQQQPFLCQTDWLCRCENLAGAKGCHSPLHGLPERSMDFKTFLWPQAKNPQIMKHILSYLFF